MDAKKLILIVVTVVAVIVSLVMINNLINRGEKSSDPAAVVSGSPVVSRPVAVSAPSQQSNPVAEESDPQSYSGPMLR